MPRLLCPDVATAALDHEVLPPDEVVAGTASRWTSLPGWSCA